MPKVFISHSWEDNEISRKLAEYLKRDGAEIWIDYARISGGESLPDRISEALEWCDTLVLLWSDSAANSYYVGLEWKSALDLQKKIIPCIVDNTKRPAILRSFLYIDFKDIENGYRSLARALSLVVKEKEQQAITHQKVAPRKKERKVSAKLKALTSSSRFRSGSKQLSGNDVTEMIKKYDFFDSKKYESGHGFDNQYEVQTIKDDKIVIDRASGLMWQLDGSLNTMQYEDAKKLIYHLNEKGYAGYKDWRLPNLEEAMSLMEPEQKNEGLYIDPVFDAKQIWIWTSDLKKGESRAAWIVDFGYGYCYWFGVIFDGFVRTVRSGQSSPE